MEIEIEIEIKILEVQSGGRQNQPLSIQGCSKNQGPLYRPENGFL